MADAALDTTDRAASSCSCFMTASMSSAKVFITEGVNSSGDSGRGPRAAVRASMAPSASSADLCSE